MYLSEFGNREMKIASNILKSISQYGYPEDFEPDGVDICFNQNSGCVYLTNSDYDVCMMNGDKLEKFYTCGECGEEGFLEDFPHNNNGRVNNCCLENINGLKKEIKNQKLKEILNG